MEKWFQVDFTRPKVVSLTDPTILNDSNKEKPGESSLTAKKRAHRENYFP